MSLSVMPNMGAISGTATVHGATAFPTTEIAITGPEASHGFQDSGLGRNSVFEPVWQVGFVKGVVIKAGLVFQGFLVFQNVLSYVESIVPEVEILTADTTPAGSTPD